MLSPIVAMFIVFGAGGVYFATAQGLRGEAIGKAMEPLAFPATLVVFTAVFLFGRWCARRDGLSLDQIGWGRFERRHAAIGVAVGVVVGLLFAFLIAPLIKRVNPAYDPTVALLGLPAMVLLQILGVAAEDTVLRGYPLTRLPARYSRTASLVIPSLFYAVLNMTQGPASAAWAFAMGVGLGALFFSQRSLWPVAIAHFLIGVTPRFLTLAGVL